MFFEGAGKITGGSKVRMAERDREGGCRRRGVAFSIPPRNGGAASAATEGIAQQIEISAAHQGLTALHEPDRSIAEVMGFPAARGHAIRPEQGCGDGAIARPILAGVKRAQGLDQAVATLGRQLAEVRARRPAGKGAPQTPRGMGAEFEEIVEWKLCRIARAETRPSPQPYAMVDVLSPQQDVPAVGCLADYCVG